MLKIVHYLSCRQLHENASPAFVHFGIENSETGQIKKLIGDSEKKLYKGLIEARL